MASTFQTIHLNGEEFFIPNPRAVDWGQKVTDFLVAIPSSVLQPNSGLFTLTEELNFGDQFGIRGLYFGSNASAFIADDGLIRLAHDETVSWRNFAKDGNLDLGVNDDDRLTFNGGVVLLNFQVLDTDSIDLTWNDPVLSADVRLSGSTLAIDSSGVKVSDGGITNTQVNASAGIVYSKLNLSNSIVNADINTSAAIAYSKLTLSNSIVNADINTAAAISFSKLAPLASTNILVGSGANVATSVTMTGDITINNSGVTAISSGVIVDADISSSAAITRSKLADGTAYRIVANNSSGVISENAALTVARATVSDTNGQLASSVTTTTELSYVSGVTSAIQTQLNGKASLALDNLASVAINTTLVSDTDNTDDLGTDAKEWKDAWVYNIKHNSVGTPNLTITTTGNNGHIVITPNGSGTTDITNPSFTGNLVVNGTITGQKLFLTNTTNQLVLGTTNTTTITSPAPSSNRVVTLPDAGADSSFVLTALAQSIAGVKTFTDVLTVVKPDLTGQVVNFSSVATNDDPNYIMYQGRTTTVNAATATIHTLTLSNSTSYLVESRVIGRRTAGSLGSANDSFSMIIKGMYKADSGGTVTLVGSATSSEGFLDNIQCDAFQTISGSTVLTQVLGALGNTYTWHTTVIVQSLSS